MLLLHFDEDNNTVMMALPAGEKPKNLEKMKDNILSQLRKTGETDYHTINVEIKDNNIPFMPISKINDLRREILSLLSKERLSNFY